MLTDADKTTVLFAFEPQPDHCDIRIEHGIAGLALVIEPDHECGLYLWQSITGATARRIVEALMPYAYPVGEEGDRVAKLPSEPPRDTLPDVEQP